MPFVCPECGDPGSLRVMSSIELPPDAMWDEITVQMVRCARCGFRAAAVYRESRRGNLDSEAVDHAGCRLPRETVEALAAAIESCPDPRNCACGCPWHRHLGGRDDAGRWLGLPMATGWFTMHLSDARKGDSA